LTDRAGKVIISYEYDAFGNITRRQGSLENAPGYLFQTKEADEESDLIYFGARYYDPQLGRWLTPDPLGMADGPNTYLYCNNNPVGFIDPWGLCKEKSDLEEVWDYWKLTGNCLKTGDWNPFWQSWKQRLKEMNSYEFTCQLAIGFSGGLKFVGGGGPIVLGRFKLGNQPAKSVLKKIAEKYNARILDKPFPKGVSLKKGLKGEIDAASKIYFRMKGVKPGYVSYDIEYKYIQSNPYLRAKTVFLDE